MFTLSAAGFMATSTSGASPGVWTSWSRSGPGTRRRPGKVPAGARISAGKSGNVDRSFPIITAVVGELVPGELHAVAGVAGEAYGHGLELFDLAPRPGRRLNAHFT